MDIKAFIKYISALLLFGLNGIVASHIPLNSYEIVFLRTLIGSVLLIVLFLLGKGKFHMGKTKSYQSYGQILKSSSVGKQISFCLPSAVLQMLSLKICMTSGILPL